MLKMVSTIPLLGFMLLVAPFEAIAQQAPHMPSAQPHFWHWSGPWHGSQFWWICLLMILFMFLVFGAIFFFFRRSWGEQWHHRGSPWHMMDRTWGPPTHSALQVLNERFARGEIQKDEYEDKKSAILSGGEH
jgi:uncharacterized membrane protein